MNQSPAPVSINRLAALIEARKKLREAPTSPSPSPSPSPVQSLGMHGESIILNSKQLEFSTLATAGKSCILVGAAGTGKTTTMRETSRALIQSGLLPIFNNVTHKYLPASGVPGIVFCAYTRRATANIRRALPEDLKANCVTIHKLLEYAPVYYEVFDPISGESRTTMRFEPSRNPYNPLPHQIHTIVIEESSMVSVELFNEIQAALSHEVQFIFLGDIQQLPPVFGSAILGYKMLELPTIELTEVYRQALESPIIRLAHRILSGTGIPASEFNDWKYPDQLTLHPWKKKIHPDLACLTFSRFITAALDSGQFNPETDIVLCPFNKSFGTDEINKQIAHHLARTNNRVVYEIVAGFNKLYFSVGDKVLYDKEDAYITEIIVNPMYSGREPQPASITLDYWGHDSGTHVKQSGMTEERVDFILSQAAIGEDDADRVHKASHILVLKRYEDDVEIRVDQAAAMNGMSLGYAITIHKSQGSEWDKVFLVFHQSHATMLQRELLYTGITRAKKELYIICEPESIERGVKSQRIKGNTLEEKAEYFKGKLEQSGMNGAESDSPQV